MAWGLQEPLVRHRVSVSKPMAAQTPFHKVTVLHSPTDLAWGSHGSIRQIIITWGMYTALIWASCSAVPPPPAFQWELWCLEGHRSECSAADCWKDSVSSDDNDAAEIRLLKCVAPRRPALSLMDAGETSSRGGGPLVLIKWTFSKDDVTWRSHLDETTWDDWTQWGGGGLQIPTFRRQEKSKCSIWWAGYQSGRCIIGSSSFSWVEIKLQIEKWELWLNLVHLASLPLIGFRPCARLRIKNWQIDKLHAWSFLFFSINDRIAIHSIITWIHWHRDKVHFSPCTIWNILQSCLIMAKLTEQQMPKFWGRAGGEVSQRMFRSQ